MPAKTQNDKTGLAYWQCKNCRSGDKHKDKRVGMVCIALS